MRNQPPATNAVVVERGVEITDEHLGPTREQLARRARRDVERACRGSTIAQLGAVDQAAVGGRVAFGVVAEPAGGERRVLGRAVRALAPAAERGARLRAPSPARRPRRRARTAGPTTCRCARTAGWSIIVRMNTGVLIITAMRSRSTSSSARAGLPRVHQHRGDRRRHREQHAVGEAGDVRDRHREQERLARAHVVRGGDRVGLDAQALVRVHDAFRVGGRARGPQDHGRIVDARRRRRAARGSTSGSGASPRTSITVPVEPGRRARAPDSRCRGTRAARPRRARRVWSRMKPTSRARRLGVIGLDDRAAAPHRPAQHDAFPPVRELPGDDRRRAARPISAERGRERRRPRAQVVDRQARVAVDDRERACRRRASSRSSSVSSVHTPSARHCGLHLGAAPGARGSLRAVHRRGRRSLREQLAHGGADRGRLPARAVVDAAARAASRRRPRSCRPRPRTRGRSRRATPRCRARRRAARCWRDRWRRSPTSGACMRSPNTSSVIRVRAAGAIAFAVTP